jgi:preprotein translocase subunit SecG
MATLVLVLMILSGILFIGSVLLMTPKGGIGFGI